VSEEKLYKYGHTFEGDTELKTNDIEGVVKVLDMVKFMLTTLPDRFNLHPDQVIKVKIILEQERPYEEGLQ
jgi:hypothetical protein